MAHAALKLSGGDVLVHSGDFSGHGTLAEMAVFADWVAAQPYDAKIVVPGNHDLQAKDAMERVFLERDIQLLIDSTYYYKGLTFYGSPWCPQFGQWAWMLPRGRSLHAKWMKIPDSTDVLITHTPPYGNGDKVEGGEHVGCFELAARVRRFQPKIHAFGHIHEGAGVSSSAECRTQFINASIMNRRYQPVNNPVEVTCGSTMS
jgi:Icc-related predicted phosphoesterase